MAIEVGDLVRLKTTDLGTSLGISTYRKNGGEAKVTAIGEDTKGLNYTVELLRNGKTRVVRRENLVIHHKPKKKTRRKK